MESFGIRKATSFVHRLSHEDLYIMYLVGFYIFFQNITQAMPFFASEAPL